MSQTYVQDIVDIAARASDLSNYRFLGVSGSVTVAGFFVDISNKQIGIAVSGTVTIGNGTNNPSAFSDLGTVPTGAEGFIGSFSAPTYLSLCGADATMLADFKANYAKYPQIQIDTLRGLGRVA